MLSPAGVVATVIVNTIYSLLQAQSLLLSLTLYALSCRHSRQFQRHHGVRGRRLIHALGRNGYRIPSTGYG